MKQDPKELEKLAKYLKKHESTVRKLSEVFKVTKACIYRRVEALSENGYKVMTRLDRGSKHGPLSAFYKVV